MRRDKRNSTKRIIAIFLVAVFVLSSLLGLASLVFAIEDTRAQFQSLENIAPKTLEQRRLVVDVYEENETSIYGEWKQPAFSYDDLEYKHYELKQFEAAIEAFAKNFGLNKDSLDKEPSTAVDEEKLKTALDGLLLEYDVFATQYAFIQYQYSIDVSNQESIDELAHMKNISSEIFNALLSTLQTLQKNSAFAPGMRAVIGETNWTDLEETPLLTARQAEIRKEQTALEQTYDKLADEANFSEKKTDEMGQIYLDLIALRNEDAREYGYEDYIAYKQDTTYGRDYTVEDLELYYAAVKENLPRLFMYLSFALDWTALDTIDFAEQTTVEVIQKYLPSISSELMDSFQYMNDRGLYTFADGTNCEQVSYTISVPAYHSALIYQSPSGAFHDFNTLVHEFGHFNTAVRNTERSFFDQSNVDIAEIHSQGLEILFLPFYRDIFGEKLAKEAMVNNLLNLVYAMLTGALYNEFETFTHSKENLTLEEINSKYAELLSEYQLGAGDDETGWMFYHMYHAPFYYLSYSVSAMASASLLAEVQKDYYGAVDKYLKLTKHGEKTFGFRELLKESELPDVLHPMVIEELTGAIYQYMQNPIYLDIKAQTELIEEKKMTTSTTSTGESEESKPSISLPEYGDGFVTEETKETTLTTSEVADDTDKSTETTEKSMHEDIWEGNEDLKPWDIIKLIPNMIQYTLSGELWQDIWNAFTGGEDGSYS